MNAPQVIEGRLVYTLDGADSLDQIVGIIPSPPRPPAPVPLDEEGVHSTHCDCAMAAIGVNQLLDMAAGPDREGVLAQTLERLAEAAHAVICWMENPAIQDTALLEALNAWLP